MKIAIIGKGSVGSALEKGLKGAGHEVRSVGNEPAKVRETANWGEVVILAVPYGAIDAAVKEMGDGVNGKPLIDVSNALTPDFKLAIGIDTSGGEMLQEKAPKAKVVKAFNTVFAQHMATGRVKGQRLTLFVAGDYADAKNRVLELGRDLGFDPVDAGPLANARWLETLGYLNIQLGFGPAKMGTDIGFKLVA